MYRVPSTRTFFRRGHLVRQLPLDTVFAPSLHARKQSQGLGDWSGAGDAQSREEKQDS